jgi:hypothetical protein
MGGEGRKERAPLRKVTLGDGCRRSLLEEAWRGILARFPDMRWTGEIVIAPNNFVHAIRKLSLSFTVERKAV